MKLVLEIVLILGVIAWATFKFYFEIDYGLVMAIVLLTLPCYALVLMNQPAKSEAKPRTGLD